MVKRISVRRTARLIAIAGLAALVGAALEPLLGADFPGCRNGNCPNCPVNSRFFGYYPTLWRRWPGTEPQPQPAPQPTAEGATIPAVEPPPPQEEIENKNKPMGTEPPSAATPGATGPTSEPDANPVPPTVDPNAKRPAVPPTDKGLLPTPMELPGKVNQLERPWRPNPAGPVSDGSRKSDPETSPSAEVWPPANILRHDEIRADFRWPDRSPAAPKNSTVRPASAQSVWPISAPSDAKQDHEKSADWVAEGIHPFGQAVPNSREHFQPPAPLAKAAADRPSLHWGDPLAPAATGKGIPEATHRSASHSFEDSAHSGSSTRPPSESPDVRPVAALGRIPFVPSDSLRDPLTPLNPRALTDRGTPQGVTPPDVANTQLAPPNKVNEITAPMIPAASARAYSEPATNSGADIVTRIDPLAIRKLLDPVRSPADFPMHDRLNSSAEVGRKVRPTAAKETNPWSDAVASSRAGVDESCGGLASRTIIPSSSSLVPSQNPAAVSPIKKAQTAALVASDGDPRFDRVQPATYQGPAAPPRPSSGRENPLRSSANSGGEAISTDGPSGWTNPLR
jgi:hypothetical protein